MKYSIQKNFIQNLLSKIKIGISKRLLFIVIKQPLQHNLIPILELLRAFGLILHFDISKSTDYII